MCVSVHVGVCMNHEDLQDVCKILHMPVPVYKCVRCASAKNIHWQKITNILVLNKRQHSVKTA